MKIEEIKKILNEANPKEKEYINKIIDVLIPEEEIFLNFSTLLKEYDSFAIKLLLEVNF